MSLLCLIGGAALMAFATLSATSGAVRLVVAFVVGGTLATLSPLSLLLLVRLNPPAQLPRANALYNAHYAAGMLVGPVVVAASIERAGTALLLAIAGGLWLVHAGFVVVASARQRPPLKGATA